MKKILSNINIIIIVLLIILSGLLIGTPLNEANVQVVYIGLGVYSICYFITKIVKKEKIEFNKLDVFVLILTFSAFIPLIFRTYISINGTVHLILKYLAIFSAYIIVKNECRKKPGYINIILKTIIFSILILCVIGLDEYTNNFLYKFKNILNYVPVDYDEKRISSLFAYPNTMAVVAGIGFFMCIGYVLSNKNIKQKIIYSVISIIMLITLILTYSRLVYIIFAFSCLILLIILFIKYNIKEKLTKKWIILIGIFIICAILYVAIGLNISQELIVKNSYQKILYSVNSNEDYNFVFNISSYSENEDNFVIRLTEKNKFFDTVNTTEIKFGTYEGEKQINLKTQENTQVIYINIENENGDKLVINNSYINGNELILKYKILPTDVVSKMQGISLKNKSAFERIICIYDASKAIKDNILFGLGGNAWKDIQLKIQSYNYSETELHSYPTQLFLDFGIVAFVAYALISICILKYLYDETKSDKRNLKNICVLTGLICLFLHNMLEFNMSYFYVHLIVFIIIAVINSEKTGKELKHSNLLYVVLIIMALINVYVFSVENHYKNNIETIRKISNETEQKAYSLYSKLLPFNKEMKVKKYYILGKPDEIDYAERRNTLEDIIKNERYIYENISLENIIVYIKDTIKTNENVEKNINSAIEYICETEDFGKYNVNLQITRLRNINKLNNLLKENNIDYSTVLENQLTKELKEKKQDILNYDRARYGKDQIEGIEKILDKIEGNI